MNAYHTLSRVYDELMDEDIDYVNYINVIESLFGRYSQSIKSICDLGCGTGTMTVGFANKGYDMIGIDLSAEMLIEAKKKAESANKEILFLQQDISQFELYGTVDACLATIDVLNYIIDEKELLNTFKWVNNYLEPDGLFVFDLNTPYKFEHLLGNETFAFQNDEFAYIWENEYDEINELNYYNIHFFIEDGNGKYQRIEEEHVERAYSIDAISMLLKKSGMLLIDVYDFHTMSVPTDKSTRIIFVAKEKGKR